MQAHRSRRRDRALAGARRLFGFSALPLFGSLSAFIALPVVARVYGGAGLASVTLGITIGAIAGYLVEGGWALNGPATIAAADAGARRRRYVEALAARMWILLAALPIAMLAAAWLAPAESATAAGSAAATTLAGLTPAWYFVGTGEPGRLFAYDTVWRVLAAVLASLLLVAGAPLVTYPALQVALTLLGQYLAYHRVNERQVSFLPLLAPQRAWPLLRAQSSVGLSRLLSTVYSALPMSLVTAVNPAAAPQFAAADRLQRYTLTAVAPVGLLLQAWVPSAASYDDTRSRVRIALLVEIALAAAVGAAFALTLPLLSALAFGDPLRSSGWAAAWAGLAITFALAVRAISLHVLVLRQAYRWMLAASAAGAVVAVPGVLLLAQGYGYAGGLAAVAGAEAAALAVTVVAAVRTKDVSLWLFREKGQEVRPIDAATEPAIEPAIEP